VPHWQCGKLVVAIEPGEDAYLGRLLQRAEENGVEDVAHIGASQLNKLEPEIKGTSALATGIVDSHASMLSYQADAEAAGATVAFRTPVLEAVIAGDDNIGLTTAREQDGRDRRTRPRDHSTPSPRQRQLLRRERGQITFPPAHLAGAGTRRAWHPF
jgi:L-2-hydroxyglutarate oxidase LhgO